MTSVMVHSTKTNAATQLLQVGLYVSGKTLCTEEASKLVQIVIKQPPFPTRMPRSVVGIGSGWPYFQHSGRDHFSEAAKINTKTQRNNSIKPSSNSKRRHQTHLHNATVMRGDCFGDSSCLLLVLFALDKRTELPIQWLAKLATR
jgi:hypothetical protein